MVSTFFYTKIKVKSFEIIEKWNKGSYVGSAIQSVWEIVKEWCRAGNLTASKGHEQPVGVKNCSCWTRPCQSSLYHPQSRQRVYSVTCCGHWLQVSRSNLRGCLEGQYLKYSNCAQMYLTDRREIKKYWYLQ